MNVILDFDALTYPLKLREYLELRPIMPFCCFEECILVLIPQVFELRVGLFLETSSIVRSSVMMHHL